MTTRSPRRARIAPVDVRLTGVAARPGLAVAFFAVAFFAVAFFAVAFFAVAFFAVAFFAVAFFAVAFFAVAFFAGTVRLPAADGSLPIYPIPIRSLPTRLKLVRRPLKSR